METYKKILNNIYSTVLSEANFGDLASYIPELAKVDENKFGVYLLTTDQREHGIGDWQERFSIQSIAKVFSLSLIYSILDGKTWERVGVEPSGTPFNSLIQLEIDNGIPRNPFLNSGALVVCDMLISELDNPKDDFIEFLRNISNNESINYSQNIAESEKSIGYRNKSLCYLIKSYGNIINDPEKVLDFYFDICSITMSCEELSKSFMYLTDRNFSINNNKILTLSQTKRINAIMQSCGFYDESGEFSFRVGLPGKSGVGGGIIAVYPEKYNISVWSPKLNQKGNSYRGMKFLELFTTSTASSIF